MARLRARGISYLGTLAVLLALGALAACGGGTTDGGNGDSFVGELPNEGPDGPGTAPGGGTGGTPTPSDPPVDPPVDPPEDPPVDPPEGPPVVPPVDPPVGPPVPPRQDVPPPPAQLPSFDGFPGVLGVTLDPATGTWYAIQSEQGRLLRWEAGQPQPTALGEMGIDGFVALAYAPPEGMLYAVTRRDGEDAALYRITPASPTAELVGPITGYARIEGLTWHAPSDALFGVDAGKDEVIQIDRNDPGSPVKVADLGLIGSPVALASDPDHDVLYAIDDTSADIVAIEPATGEVRRMATLVEGSMLGLAFDPAARRFLGASPSGTMQIVDPMGEWMERRHIQGLAYDGVDDVLYGSYVPNGLLVRIERDSGWRQVLGYLALPRLECLAWDEVARRLWTVSRSRGALYRINPENMTVATIGDIKDLGGQVTWKGLSSLAHVDNRLVAVDSATGTVLSIDPSDATATALTAVSPQGDVRSLSFDAKARKLHAVSNRNGNHFVLLPDAGWVREDGTEVDGRQIGALAWLPAEERLLGMELVLDRLVQVAPLEAPSLPFDEVAALALSHGDLKLMGFDLEAQVLLGLQPDAPEAKTLEGMSGSAIYGMAFAPAHDVFFAADATGGTLWRITREGQHEAVAGGGTLGTHVLHALAYDGTNDVLWGVDLDSRRLVTIDTGSGVATVAFPALPELPFETIEAMSWDPDTGTFVAVDQATRRLVEIDPATGDAHAYAEIQLAAVTGAAVVPETGELLVIDTDLDRVIRLDRFTGILREPFDPLEKHRGLDNDTLISLLWPRGDVRAGGWSGFAIQLGLDYEKKGTLVFKRGEDVLFERAFEPERIFEIGPIPEVVHKAVKPGDVITWGIVYADGEDIVAEVTVVDRPEAAADLAGLKAIPSLKEAKPWVRAACAARVLSRHGLHTEAFEHIVTSPDLPKENQGIARAFATALRGFEFSDATIGSLFTQFPRK